MKIQTAWEASPSTGRHFRVRPAGETAGMTININVADPLAANQDKKPVSDPTAGKFGELLIKGVGFETAIVKGGSFLIDGLHNTTPDQLAGAFTKYNLITDPSLAHSEASKALNYVQSKGGSALLIGATVGTMMMVAVDTVRPQWPFRTKLTIAIVTGALVAALLYFGLNDKSERPPAPGASAQQSAPAQAR